MSGMSQNMPHEMQYELRDYVSGRTSEFVSYKMSKLCQISCENISGLSTCMSDRTSEKCQNILHEYMYVILWESHEAE